ncbi:hypothetical protein C7M84_014075 [Penaeus vannamei]|uniref:Uncharacterized protein n=1 Tax=Penaeus vannamei TaxID=6689 RepID=A0A423SUJ4_PENVA|nr:hypothetical protein C7M84_014075 [Penaeus vannamei]
MYNFLSLYPPPFLLFVPSRPTLPSASPRPSLLSLLPHLFSLLFHRATSPHLFFSSPSLLSLLLPFSLSLSRSLSPFSLSLSRLSSLICSLFFSPDSPVLSCSPLLSLPSLPPLSPSLLPLSPLSIPLSHFPSLLLSPPSFISLSFTPSFFILSPSFLPLLLSAYSPPLYFVFSSLNSSPPFFSPSLRPPSSHSLPPSLSLTRFSPSFSHSLPSFSHSLLPLLLITLSPSFSHSLPPSLTLLTLPFISLCSPLLSSSLPPALLSPLPTPSLGLSSPSFSTSVLPLGCCSPNLPLSLPLPLFPLSLTLSPPPLSVASLSRPPLSKTGKTTLPPLVGCCRTLLPLLPKCDAWGDVAAVSLSAPSFSLRAFSPSFARRLSPSCSHFSPSLSHELLPPLSTGDAQYSPYSNSTPPLSIFGTSVGPAPVVIQTRIPQYLSPLYPPSSSPSCSPSYLLNICSRSCFRPSSPLSLSSVIPDPGGHPSLALSGFPLTLSLSLSLESRLSFSGSGRALLLPPHFLLTPPLFCSAPRPFSHSLPSVLSGPPSVSLTLFLAPSHLSPLLSLLLLLSLFPLLSHSLPPLLLSLSSPSFSHSLPLLLLSLSPPSLLSLSPPPLSLSPPPSRHSLSSSFLLSPLSPLLFTPPSLFSLSLFLSPLSLPSPSLPISPVPLPLPSPSPSPPPPLLPPPPPPPSLPLSLIHTYSELRLGPKYRD